MLDHAEGPPACFGVASGGVLEYLNVVGITGLAFAWAMARRRPKEYLQILTIV